MGAASEAYDNAWGWADTRCSNKMVFICRLVRGWQAEGIKCRRAWSVGSWLAEPRGRTAAAYLYEAGTGSNVSSSCRGTRGNALLFGRRRRRRL
jgi:hypothetical protein